MSEKMVEMTMDAEARPVSLLSCEDKTKMAVGAGRAKYIMATFNGSPLILNTFKKKYPHTGKATNLTADARRAVLKYL